MTNPNKNEYQKNTKQFPQKIQANSTQNPNKFHTISRSISTEGEQIPGQFRTNSNKTM